MSITDPKFLPFLPFIPSTYNDTMELLSTNRALNEIRKDENFWERKALVKYGKTLPPRKTPAQRYEELETRELKYLPHLTEQELELLNFVSGHFKFDSEIEIIDGIVEDNLNDNPEYYVNFVPDEYKTNVDYIQAQLYRLVTAPILKQKYLVLKSGYTLFFSYDQDRPTITQKILVKSENNRMMTFLKCIKKAASLGYTIQPEFIRGGYTKGIPILLLDEGGSYQLSFKAYEVFKQFYQLPVPTQ